MAATIHNPPCYNRPEVAGPALHATVRNANGRLVPDLTAADFDIRDEGQPVAISVFSSDPQPIVAAASGGGPTVIHAGDMVMMRGGAPGAGAARYRVNFNLGVQNLTNRVNHTGWNGTMTSPFFRQATSVGQPRKINLGVTFSF